MCLALPGEVVALLGEGMARVRFGETEMTVSLALVEEVKPGDFVVAHAGFAITKLDREEAEATLQLWRELEAAARRA
ncbi:MAG: HypC/HybG/HupF family hydrogenase formation chaperone [bacterium]|nr:HypC/HybG/HupF family hydrogenase formation chaperone [bacterium]